MSAQRKALPAGASTSCIDHGRKGDKDGYFQTTRSGKAVFLHRLIFCRTHGLSIDQIKGLVVRHSCDNARCINPDHLQIGTHADNHRDMVLRGRRPAHTIPKLSDADVLYIRANCKPSSKGRHAPAADQSRSYFAMAKRFGVATGVVRRVYLNETYRHVTGGAA